MTAVIRKEIETPVKAINHLHLQPLANLFQKIKQIFFSVMNNLISWIQSHQPHPKEIYRTSFSKTEQKIQDIVDPTIRIPENMRFVKIPADGHCMFRSIATGLNYADIPIQDLAVKKESPLGSDDQVLALRDIACRRNEEILDRPPLPLPTDDFHTQDQLRIEGADTPEYFQQMRTTSMYGGDLECKAIAKALGIQITLIAYDRRSGHTFTQFYNRNPDLSQITLYYRPYIEREADRISDKSHYDLLIPKEDFSLSQE